MYSRYCRNQCKNALTLLSIHTTLPLLFLILLKPHVSDIGTRGWYLKVPSTPTKVGASKGPTYPAHVNQWHNASL
jgi:hypothetical protein